MQNTPFNLVSTIAVLQKQWKTISLFVLFATLVATVTVFVVPPYFRSQAVIVSANPLLADKAHLFNPNIQELYSYFGNSDDLDRVYGIADMDTTYQKLVDDFALTTYYELSGDSLAVLRRKAVQQLKKDISIQKTEQGQLNIIAWTKTPGLSAHLVNKLVDIVQEQETEVWKKNYSTILTSLTASISGMEKEYQELNDSLVVVKQAKHDLLAARMQTILEQLKQYHKTANEYRLAIQAPPAAVYVMQAATPAAKAERPDKPLIIFIVFITSFVFASLLVLIKNRNQ